MAVSQRPLSLGEILDRTVQLYRRNFLPFAGISALPAGISVLVFGSAGAFLGSRMATFKADTADFTAIGVTVGLLLLIGVPLILAGYTLDLSASNYAARLANEGEKAAIRASYGYAFKHFWRHLGLLCLQALFAGVIPYCVFIGIFVVGAGLAGLAAKGPAATAFAGLFVTLLILLVIALLVVMLLIWLRYSLAFAASVVEEKAAWPSMKRSAQLSKGTKGRIFVMFLLVSILSSVATYALLIPLLIIAALVMQKSLVGNQPPTEFLIVTQASVMGVSFLVRAIITPVYSTALMLFYFDQRTRQEGYDIERLMEQAGWSTLPPALPPLVPVSFAAEAYPPLPAVDPGQAVPSPLPIAEQAVAPSVLLEAEAPVTEPEARPEATPEAHSSSSAIFQPAHPEETGA